MKLLTPTLAAALVMAVTGCETSPLKKYGSVEAYAAKTATDPTKPYFGDGKPLKPPPYLSGPKGQLPDNVIFQVAPYIPPQPAAPPQPVIVTGPGSAPVTTVTPMAGGGTQIVNYGAPTYSRPLNNPYLWGY